MTTISMPEYADAEEPMIVGGRLYFQHIPNPPSSLMLHKNGLLMSNQAGDYFITGQVVTPNPAPEPEDKFIGWYRY
jgi:hypothetical protein